MSLWLMTVDMAMLCDGNVDGCRTRQVNRNDLKRFVAVGQLVLVQHLVEADVISDLNIRAIKFQQSYCF